MQRRKYGKGRVLFVFFSSCSAKSAHHLQGARRIPPGQYPPVGRIQELVLQHKSAADRGRFMTSPNRSWNPRRIVLLSDVTENLTLPEFAQFRYTRPVPHEA